jgi:hypothetical protein
MTAALSIRHATLDDVYRGIGMGQTGRRFGKSLRP